MVVGLRVLNEMMDCPLFPCDDKETTDPWGDWTNPIPNHWMNWLHLDSTWVAGAFDWHRNWHRLGLAP